MCSRNCHSNGARLDVQDRATDRSATALTIGYVGSHGYHQILSEDQNTPHRNLPRVALPGSACAGTIFYPSQPRPIQTLPTPPPGSRKESATTTGSKSMCAASTQRAAAARCLYMVEQPRRWLGMEHKRFRQYPGVCIFPGNHRLTTGPPPPISAMPRDQWHLGVAFSGGLLANPVAKQLVGGWSVSGIATIQSGFPFSPQLGYNPTGSGDTRNPVRPNLAPNFRLALCQDSSAVVQSGCILPRLIRAHLEMSAATRSRGPVWRS